MDIPLPAVSHRIKDHRQGRSRRAHITAGEIEDAAGDDEQPQDIHHSHAPHDRPENLYDERIDIENSGRLVVPKVAIKELAVEKSLPNHTVSGLVPADGKAQVGKRPQEDHYQSTKKPDA